MKQLFKNILTIAYLKNKGTRRLCLVLGILLALIPLYFFMTGLYVNKTLSLRDAVVNASEKQQQFVFTHYPYKCNFCDLETNFDRWKATFGSWKHANDVQHADCSKLRDPSGCTSSKKYLAQKIKINYFNFAAFSFLAYALILFYLPFLIACAIQWIAAGFSQGKSAKKK